jgi:hypothetical protein
MEAALTAADERLTLVVNERYATDTNIGSLLRGLAGRDDPALIFEADIACDDAAVQALAGAAAGPDSVWFSTGSFRPYALGGCLRAGADGWLTDLRYVPENGPQFADYRKLLGAVYAGPREMPVFHRCLRDAAERSLAQYYMMPWCAHLAALPARDRDLSGCRTATFNTPEEYRRCLALFETNLEEIHAC